MVYNLPDAVLQDISQFAEKHGIRRVLLFGSRARGTQTERSDIDLAVCGGDFDGFYWDIKENVHSLLMIDVVDLDAGVSEGLKRELERDGVTLYEKVG
ncbi:nucleotidyltransferase domain-containing protein [Megasphaera sp.]|uniref:nucleotidyltransferase family protein n=1 Tax=Megasphaera sp. TaxID=2023260 RepID=UPI0025845056|nr:nucleotidyltransferase domain-containing protein [Megasphaera sp.]